MKTWKLEALIRDPGTPYVGEDTVRYILLDQDLDAGLELEIVSIAPLDQLEGKEEK